MRARVRKAIDGLKPHDREVLVLVYLEQLRPQEVAQIVGASEKAELSLDRCDLRRPTAVVIGNEGRGLRPEVAAACTALVRIPQHGQINSLNAAAAAAVLLYEARRQRGVTE